MPAPSDLVHETSTSTGTGDLTLTNVNGKRSFNTAFSTGGTDAFDYYISNRDAAEWERGTGHLSDATTLVRDTVIASSNSNNAVNFSSGTKDVTNDIPAASQTHISLSQTLTNKDISSSTNTYRGATASAIGAAKLWTVAVITTTDSSWGVPAGTLEMIIEAWGGGAGGGAQAGGTQRGGGGGAGSYLCKYYTGTMDSTLNITIGAGGAATANGGNTTVVGSNLGTLTAPGGTAGDNTGTGGAGGTTPTGGDINIVGGQGGGVPTTTAVGFGGDAPRGGLGGKRNVGFAGAEPGGGGSGENHTGGGAGAGAKGWVIIYTR